jgi:hypothetical protein
MTEFRKGDVVAIRATVEFIYDNTDETRVSVKPDGHYTSIMLDPKHLALVHHAYSPGDRVFLDTNNVGTVLAVCDGKAWVKYDNGNYGSPALCMLSPYRDEPTAIAA